MARIRTIKPEFPQSESMGRVSRDARLTFILLWTLADDSGRLRGSSRMLASLLYPYDDDSRGLMEGWLVELDLEGCIVRYEVSGNSYIEIANWQSHQKIDKPSASKNPAPREGSRILANPREVSSEDQGPRTKEGIKDQGPEDEKPEVTNSGDLVEVDTKQAPTNIKVTPMTQAQLVEQGLEPDVAAEFLALRKRKSAPLTPRAWRGIAASAQMAGWPIGKAVEKMLARGWAGVEPSWLQKEQHDMAQQSDGYETPRMKAERLRAAELSGGYAQRAAPPSAPQPPKWNRRDDGTIIDMDAELIRIGKGQSHG